jgi:hypothetical protein
MKPAGSAEVRAFCVPLRLFHDFNLALGPEGITRNGCLSNEEPLNRLIGTPAPDPNPTVGLGLATVITGAMGGDYRCRLLRAH